MAKKLLFYENISNHLFTPDVNASLDFWPETKKVLNEINFEHPLLKSYPAFIFLLHYPSRKFVYMAGQAEKITGFPKEEIEETGLSFFTSRMHKDDLEVICNNLIPCVINQSKTIENTQLTDYWFSYNFRFRREDNSWVNLMQQFYIVERDEKKNPVSFFGTISDISAYTNDHKIIISLNELVGNRPTVNKLHFLTNKNVNVTTREKEILEYILKGLTSKEIADRLSISSLTVNVHRKNLLEKLNAKNTAELLKVAYAEGVLS